MTTDTTERDEAAPEAAGGEEAAAAPPAPEPVRFWDRPAVDRYLVPVLLPVLVVAGLVMFVLNVSRIFLAEHGNVPVVVGTLITVVILVGATVLSAAPRMRSSSLALVTGAFVFAVLMGGWLSLGHAEPEEEVGAGLPPEGPAAAELEFRSDNFFFDPATVETQTGIVRITLNNVNGQHTFVFETPGTEFAGLEVQNPGDTDTARAFFGEPGEYVFYCSVPGHRAAGRQAGRRRAGRRRRGGVAAAAVRAADDRRADEDLARVGGAQRLLQAQRAGRVVVDRGGVDLPAPREGDAEAAPTPVDVELRLRVGGREVHVDREGAGTERIGHQAGLGVGPAVGPSVADHHRLVGAGAGFGLVGRRVAALAEGGRCHRDQGDGHPCCDQAAPVPGGSSCSMPVLHWEASPMSAPRRWPRTVASPAANGEG